MIDRDILDVEGSGDNPSSLSFQSTRYGNDCSTIQMESTTEWDWREVMNRRYSVEGCVASRDNRSAMELIWQIERLCNVTLINASVFFAQEGITCQSGTFGQWMDVRWKIAKCVNYRSTYCTQRGKDVFDYLKYSLGDTEHKELYYENGRFMNVVWIVDIFRLDGIVYIQDGR